MIDLSFKLYPEILIGADTLSLSGSVCSRYGQRIMIAAGQDLNSQITSRLKDILNDSGIEAIIFDGIMEDSHAGMADNIVELSNAAHCNAIIGIGGEKTQIIARMAAIMAPTRMTAFELLEGKKPVNKFLPLIAIPTSGFEPFMLCDYFIAADPRDRLVKSVSSPDRLYAAVIADSTLFQFPAASLFDGFFTALESYCSSKANFLSDALLERALNFFARLIKNGSRGINSDIYVQAAFLAALGNSASSPGAGTALSAALNARCPAPRQSCSSALFPVIAQRLIYTRPEKMARAASLLGNTGKGASAAEAANTLVENIRRSMEALSVNPSLKNFGLSLDKAVPAAEAVRNLEFVSNSPWIVSEGELFDILKQIIN